LGTFPMKIQTVAAIAAMGAALSGCAQNYIASPIAEGDQQIRYAQGIATTMADRDNGSVQVTSLGSADNRLVFGAAAFNKGKTSVNFGLENVTITSGGKPLRTYSRDELAHEAKVQAQWAAVATALAGAAAAYSANQAAYQQTNGTIIGSRGGMISYHETTYNPGVAVAGTAIAGAATAYELNSIKNSLDNTISHLNGSILQMNTVDPGNSAGGEIVVDLPKAKTFPQPLEISVSWNGGVYTFEFDVAKSKS
jgi:hypothetical protein